MPSAVIVAERVKLLDELLREWITPLLKTKGFKKAGVSYEKDDADAVVVVGYHRSRDAGDCDKFTVNLGIGSKRIFAFEE